MSESSCIGCVIFHWLPQAESSVLVLSDFAYIYKVFLLPEFESRIGHVCMKADVFKLIHIHSGTGSLSLVLYLCWEKKILNEIDKIYHNKNPLTCQMFAHVS